MRRIIFILTLALLLPACLQCTSTPEEQAAAAALKSYRYLQKGDCEAFLRGKAGYDSLPADYRELLVGAVRQWMDEENSRRGGLRHVTSTKALRDSLTGGINAFLLLQFADSTSEEILVPMTDDGGKWRMR